MAKITWLEATKAHTSRARRRNLRKEARLKAHEEEKLHRENAVMENGCSNVVFKALYLPTSFRELPAEISKNEDASFHVVNHAHQRSPRKKWS